MSKTAEDILKEMDAVTKLADDLDAVVAASDAAAQSAQTAAAKPVTVVPPVPSKSAEPVVPGLKLPLSELLKPAYKPDQYTVAPVVPTSGGEAQKTELRREEVPLATPALAGAPVAEGAQRPELTSGNRPGVSVLPATGKILENLSGSLDLLMIGMHASIQRARIQEQDEQLGVLSMVIANLKKVQSQVDGILGRI